MEYINSAGTRSEKDNAVSTHIEALWKYCVIQTMQCPPVEMLTAYFKLLY